MFIDEAEIFVRAGKGGQGAVSFRREKFAPMGGPDGGNGGDGGSVVFVVDLSRNTLLDFARRRLWHAENGRPGAGSNRTGRSGRDLRIRVPVGTLILDRDRGSLLKDLRSAEQEVVIAQGGKGGNGNRAYVSSTHQAPREFEPGVPGEERWLKLELRLIADIGLVGMPNAGKSTLLSRLSQARPKIASYPFTTLEPQLGIVELSGFRRLVMADIPGLIEGAHGGVGLGDAFLKHIERTRILVHMIDVCPLDGEPKPAEAYRLIRNELSQYSDTLVKKREIVVANKIDLTDTDNAVEALGAELGVPVAGISAATGAGLEHLTNLLWTVLEVDRADRPQDPAPLIIPPHRVESPEPENPTP